MSDDPKKRGPADASRVNVNEAWELRYWSERFGVTPDRLKEASKAAGPMVSDIERYLKPGRGAGEANERGY